MGLRNVIGLDKTKLMWYNPFTERNWWKGEVPCMEPVERTYLQCH